MLNIKAFVQEDDSVGITIETDEAVMLPGMVIPRELSFGLNEISPTLVIQEFFLLKVIEVDFQMFLN